MKLACRIVLASLAAMTLQSCLFKSDDRRDVGGFVDDGIADTSHRGHADKTADKQRSAREAMTITAGPDWALDGRKLADKVPVRLLDLDPAHGHELNVGGRKSKLDVAAVSALRMDMIDGNLILGEAWGLPTRRTDVERLATVGTTINYKGEAWTMGNQGPVAGELSYHLDLAKGSALDSGYGTITGVESLAKDKHNPDGIHGISRIELDGWAPLQTEDHSVTGGGMAHLRFKDVSRNPRHENKSVRPDNKTSFLYSFRLMGDLAEEIVGGVHQDMDESTPKPAGLPGGPYSVPFHGRSERPR